MPDAEKVNSMFGRIASRYDLTNHALTLGIDHLWRERLVDEVDLRDPKIVIDLATGSGDVAFALRNGLQSDVKITGLDFCAPMIDEAVAKRAKRGEPEIEFGIGDILNLDIPSQSADAVTISFGYRNLQDRIAGLREIYRILKPNTGHIFILEFSQPYGVIRPFYYFYLKNILPYIGGILTADKSAYTYLCDSIEAFPDRAGISAELEEANFEVIEAIPLMFSSVALHIARAK